MQLVDRYGNNKNDVLCVTGNVVKTQYNETSVLVHSLDEVKNLFYQKYGITPTSDYAPDYVPIYANGNAQANGVHIEGGTYSNGNGFYAVCDSQPNGDVHIVFAYLYDASKGVE